MSSTHLKIKAHFVIALVNRNQQKFDEARKSLENAIKEADKVAVLDPKKNDPVMKAVRQTYRELTDPAGYYLPVVENLENIGNWNAALNELNLALLALPQDPRLSARRALVPRSDSHGQHVCRRQVFGQDPGRDPCRRRCRRQGSFRSRRQ